MVVLMILLAVAVVLFLWCIIKVAAEADRIERSIWENDDFLEDDKEDAGE